MAFKKLADLDCANATGLGGIDKKTGKKNPTSIEGYFMGTRQVPSKLSQTGFANLHVFQTEKGNVGVFGKTNMDPKLASVKPGTMTRVTFVGTVPTKFQPMYKYEVEVDESDVIDVAGAVQQAATSTDEYESEESSFNGEDDVDAQVAPMDEVPPQRAKPPVTRTAPPSSDRADRVREMLAKSRSKSV